MLIARLALPILVATATTAGADPLRGRSTAASVNIDAGYEHSRGLRRETLGLGVRAGISPAGTLLAVVGFDIDVGLAQPTGFAYRFNLLPVGLGVVLGALGRVSLVSGVGVDGVSGSVPVAGHVPIEVRFDLRLGSRVRLEMSGTLVEVFGRPSRENGSEHAPFGDEMAVQLNVRVGESYPRHRLRSSNGYYVGAVYGESGSGQSLGIVVGHSLDFAR